MSAPHRITLALLAFNQQKFIESAVRSALAQDCEPIQVILSDDCSTDAAHALMQKMADAYAGPHMVLVRRNETNLGIGAEGNDLGVIRVDRLQGCYGLGDWLAGRPYVIGAAHAVTWRLFERFGSIAADVSHEDQVTTLRALLGGGAHTLDEPLVRYRRGGFSSKTFSAKSFRLWEARRNAVFLAVCAQWKRDASSAGCEASVDAALSWQIQR